MQDARNSPYLRLEGLFAAVALCCAAAAAGQERNFGPASLEARPAIQPAFGGRPAFPVAPGGAQALAPGYFHLLGGSARTGRFRLIARGFHVDHETYDNVSEADGRGDEVYVRADVFAFDLSGNPPVQSVATTHAIGDNKPLHGGSAGGGTGDPGGFRTGDSYPTSSPWAMIGSVRERDLPLVLWEGELTQGADAVVVIPTIWEWDDFGASPEERRWERLLAPAVTAQGPMIGDAIRSGSESIFYDDLLSLGIFNEGTRPIGSSRPRDTMMPVDVLVLTFASAQKMANSVVHERICEERDGLASCIEDNPRPRGVQPVYFIDGHDMLGAYRLYLYMEQSNLVR